MARALAVRRAAWCALALAVLACALRPAPLRAAPLALGAYVRGASEDPGLIDRFGREAGREPVIVLSYKDWSSLPFNSHELDAIWRRGAVPLITWEPWTSAGHGFPLSGIAAGRFDRYLRRAAGEARLWGRPLFVRFAQEMNGTWFPWGQGHGNSAREFRKAWKHVVDLFRFHGAGNVRWVWSPNEDSGGTLPLAPYYPGDAWVDWIALDGFDFGGTVGWPSFTTIFGSSYERLAALTDRPMMIAETGAGEDGGDKAEWISSALEREAPRFSRLRALVWYDARRPDADFRIDSSPEALSAFRKAVSEPEFGADRTTLLATPSRLGGGTAAPAEPDGGYGTPSFFERLKLKLHGRYLWLALGLLVVALLLMGALVTMRRWRRGRRRAPAQG